MHSKKVLITEIDQPLGQAIALHLSQAGYTLFLHYTNNDYATSKTLHDLEKKGHTSYQINLKNTDVRDIQTIEALFKKHPDIDILIATHTLFQPYTDREISLHRLHEFATLNLLYPTTLCQHAINTSITQLIPIHVESTHDILSHTVSQKGIREFTQIASTAFSNVCRINSLYITPVSDDTIYNTSMENENNTSQHTLKSICNGLDFLLNTPEITGEILHIKGAL